MSEVRRGGCQCGWVRYRVSQMGGLIACHCHGCQRQSGSAFGLSLDVPTDAFELESGELRSFTVSCDSGREKECAFCPRCGTRIYHMGEWGMSLKAGTLDEFGDLEPATHFWTGSKQAWVKIPDGVLQVEDDG